MIVTFYKARSLVSAKVPRQPKTKIPNCLPQVLALVLWVVVAASIPSISVGAGLGGGTKQAKTNTLAKLYGEHDAMVVAARQKGCAFAQHIKIYGE